MTRIEETQETAATVPGRPLVVTVLLGAVLVAGYFVAGMPGMDHGPSAGDEPMASMDHGSVTFMRLGPADFAARVSSDAFVVNAHRPYDGEIDGTDAFIPYDAIAGDGRLPADRDAEILLYCRSGRMSGVAAEALAEEGYVNVAHLEGGMDAWEAAAMPVRRVRPAEDG